MKLAIIQCTPVCCLLFIVGKIVIPVEDTNRSIGIFFYDGV